MIRRRDFVAGLATAIPEVAGQLGDSNERNRTVGSAVEPRLVRIFEGAELGAVSPDGRRLCLYLTRHPNSTFVWRGRWKNITPQRTGDQLKILDLGSFEAIYTTTLPQMPFRVSFFSESRDLFAQTGPFRDDEGLKKQFTLVNLKTSKRVDTVRPVEPRYSESYFALTDGRLLGQSYDDRVKSVTTVFLAEIPSFRKILTAPLLPDRGKPLWWPAEDVVVSADRRTFAYAADGHVVCRRSENLEVLWTRPTRRAMMAWRVAVSAGGERVAVSFTEGSFRENEGRYHIDIYEGRSGEMLAALPVNGRESIAISPDLRFLAVGKRQELDTSGNKIEMTVELFEIASGKQVARLSHDRRTIGRGQSSYGSFLIYGIQFAGKHIITSGVDTKVWAI